MLLLFSSTLAISIVIFSGVPPAEILLMAMLLRYHPTSAEMCGRKSFTMLSLLSLLAMLFNLCFVKGSAFSTQDSDGRYVDKIPARPISTEAESTASLEMCPTNTFDDRIQCRFLPSALDVCPGIRYAYGADSHSYLVITLSEDVSEAVAIYQGLLPHLALLPLISRRVMVDSDKEFTMPHVVLQRPLLGISMVTGLMPLSIMFETLKYSQKDVLFLSVKRILRQTVEALKHLALCGKFLGPYFTLGSSVLVDNLCESVVIPAIGNIVPIDAANETVLPQLSSWLYYWAMHTDSMADTVQQLCNLFYAEAPIMAVLDSILMHPLLEMLPRAVDSGPHFPSIVAPTIVSRRQHHYQELGHFSFESAHSVPTKLQPIGNIWFGILPIMSGFVVCVSLLAIHNASIESTVNMFINTVLQTYAFEGMVHPIQVMLWPSELDQSSLRVSILLAVDESRVSTLRSQFNGQTTMPYSVDSLAHTILLNLHTFHTRANGVHGNIGLEAVYCLNSGMPEWRMAAMHYGFSYATVPSPINLDAANRVSVPLWVAPEHVDAWSRGEYSPTQKADIWGLGLLLLYLTGDKIEASEMSDQNYATTQLQHEPGIIRWSFSRGSTIFYIDSKIDSVHDELRAQFIRRCLSHNPERRPSTGDLFETGFMKAVLENVPQWQQHSYPFISIGDVAIGMDPKRSYIIGTMPIGTGASGTIFEAMNRMTGIKYAVKRTRFFFPGAIPTTEQEWNKLPLLHEARLLMKISHPAIVKGYGAMCYVDIQSGLWTLDVIMDLANSSVFHALQSQNFTPVPKSTMRRIVRAVLSALTHLHQRRIVHGDVKVENVLVYGTDINNRETHFKLCDFGLSMMIPDNYDANSQECHRGSRSTSYVQSPEQIKGLPTGNSIDIWALGVLVMELCKGEPFIKPYLTPAQNGTIPTPEETSKRWNSAVIKYYSENACPMPTLDTTMSDDELVFLMNECFFPTPSMRATAEQLFLSPMLNMSNLSEPDVHFLYRRKMPWHWYTRLENSSPVPSSLKSYVDHATKQLVNLIPVFMNHVRLDHHLRAIIWRYNILRKPLRDSMPSPFVSLLRVHCDSTLIDTSVIAVVSASSHTLFDIMRYGMPGLSEQVIIQVARVGYVALLTFVKSRSKISRDFIDTHSFVFSYEMSPSGERICTIRMSIPGFSVSTSTLRESARCGLATVIDSMIQMSPMAKCKEAASDFSEQLRCGDVSLKSLSTHNLLTWR